MITGMEMRFFTNVNTAENTQHSAAAIPAINSALTGKFSSVTMYPKEHPAEHSREKYSLYNQQRSHWL